MTKVIAPLFDLLSKASEYQTDIKDGMLHEEQSILIEKYLNEFNVPGHVVEVCKGPVFTIFKLQLAQGVSTRRFSSLENDLSRLLCVNYLHVIEHVSGTPYAGIQILNFSRQLVYLSETIDTVDENCSSSLDIALGVNIQGQPVNADLRELSHLLIGGTSGSGKSVLLNSMILSILIRATPSDVRFIIIDPRTLDFAVYNGIPHLLTPVVTDIQKALNTLRWLTTEMDNRFMLMSALGIDSLSEYNQIVEKAISIGKPIPNPFLGINRNIPQVELSKIYEIVLVIDDFIDLLNQTEKRVEEVLIQLIKKSHIAGIHLILSTQRASTDIISGHIKAIVLSRISLTVASQTESKNIINQTGAEQLLGDGDMLFSCPGLSHPLRLQGAFFNEYDAQTVTKYWKLQQESQYINGIDGNYHQSHSVGDDDIDPLFDEAVNYVVEKRKASVSGIQRHLRIGYNRAAHIIEKMEIAGIVSPQGHNGNREVLTPPIYKPTSRVIQRSEKNTAILNVTKSGNDEYTDIEEIIEISQKRGILGRIVDRWKK